MKKKITTIALLAAMTFSIGAVTLTGCGSSGSESSTAPSSSDEVSSELSSADAASITSETEVEVPDKFVKDSYDGYDYKVPKDCRVEEGENCKYYYFENGDFLIIGTNSDPGAAEINDDYANTLMAGTAASLGSDAEFVSSLEAATLKNGLTFYHRSIKGNLNDFTEGILTPYVTIYGDKMVFVQAFSFNFNNCNYNKILDKIAESVTNEKIEAKKKAEAEAAKKAKEKAAADKKAAKKVDSMIAQADFSDIEGNAAALTDIFHAYEKLTSDQKALVAKYDDKVKEACDIARTIMEAPEYDYETIARNPNKYIGDNIKVTGAVRFPIENGNSYEIQLATDTYQYLDGYGYGDVYTVYYTRGDNEDRILSGDTVTVYGYLDGIDDGIGQDYPIIRALYVKIH